MLFTFRSQRSPTLTSFTIQTNHWRYCNPDRKEKLQMLYYSCLCIVVVPFESMHCSPMRHQKADENNNSPHSNASARTTDSLPAFQKRPRRTSSRRSHPLRGHNATSVRVRSTLSSRDSRPRATPMRISASSSSRRSPRIDKHASSCLQAPTEAYTAAAAACEPRGGSR